MSIAASVLIPVHDGAGFIGDAIASALAQTCREIEVVVVDDGSTDGSWEAITGWAGRDPRVVPLRRAASGGPAAARNAAIGRARGRWLALLDADDLFLPERLERLIAEAERRGADLLADNLLEQDFETGAAIGPHFSEAAMRHEGPVPPAELLRRAMPDQPERGNIGYAQPILRRELLARHGIRYAEDIRVGEDLLLLFECVARGGGRLHLTPEAHYVYRVRQGSISHRRDGTLHLSAANRRMLDLAQGRLGDPDLVALLRRRQRLIDFHSFALEMQRGRYRAALGYAHLAPPARPWRQLRVALGAMRRRMTGGGARQATG